MNIQQLPYDIFYVISTISDYTSFFNLKLTCKEFYSFEDLFYKKKSNIIKIGLRGEKEYP